MNALQRCGYLLGCWLSCPRSWHRQVAPREEAVLSCLVPGDVLLVEGSSRLSTVIKYLTQSTWSHAALFVGEEACRARLGLTSGECFIEADLAEGVRAVSFAEFERSALRICRPIGLRPDEPQALIDYACHRVGHRYDLRNILDLARYLFPLPPVPVPWRRHMLTLGSGDATRAICSTLIAQAFQSVHYPILPQRTKHDGRGPERWRRRHYSLFTPRDFDLSPYFSIVKPRLEEAFDPHRIAWGKDVTAEPAERLSAPVR